MERRNALKAATSLLAGGGLALAAGGARADPQARRTAVRSGFPYVETARRTSLFYTDWGDGDAAVVFVHGWPLQSLMWQYQMLHLVKAGVRVISYDQRGCGRSTDPGSGYTFDRMADDLAALIDQLGLKQVVLVGHSIGCGQIVRYLSRHGASRVSGIVLLAASLPFIQKSPDNPDGVDGSHFEHLRALITADLPKWLATASKTFFMADTSPETVQWGMRMCMENSIWAMIQTNHIDVETDFRGELPKLKVRTLVVHGDGDLTCPLETTGRKLAQLIPGAALKVYAGAKHGLNLTHKDAFNDDLLAFVKT